VKSTHLITRTVKSPEAKTIGAQFELEVLPLGLEETGTCLTPFNAVECVQTLLTCSLTPRPQKQTLNSDEHVRSVIPTGGHDR
jgi:hypothetical protein